MVIQNLKCYACIYIIALCLILQLKFMMWIKVCYTIQACLTHLKMLIKYLKYYITKKPYPTFNLLFLSEGRAEVFFINFLFTNMCYFLS